MASSIADNGGRSCINASAVVVPKYAAEIAEALAKKSGCLKCHSVSQKKDAPSYKSIAEKYKGKPDAEATLARIADQHPLRRLGRPEDIAGAEPRDR